MSRSWLIGCVVAIVLACGGGCANAPTLPLPPPVITQITAPSSTGFVTIEGTGKALATVSVYNRDTEHGEIERADEEGVYVLVIEGQSGDTLVLWQQSGNATSQHIEMIVPSPR